MLDKLIDVVECEICSGVLELDTTATVDDYAVVTTTNARNLHDKIDEIINKYLVYKCSSCGQIYKYTYKDLEYLFRKNLTERMLLLVVRGHLLDAPSLQDKFFVYCGKCKGFDGLGSCPKTIYDKCEIKRFPINGL